MTTDTPVQLDRERILELTERETARLDERTRGSGEMYDARATSLSGGVASTYQARDPWPIYLTTGEGAVVHDVDGNRMWDFHNGFGSMVQGHANPAIVRAVQRAGVRSGPTSRPRPRTASSSPRSCSGAGASSAGASSTPARRRRWTRSGSRAA